MAELTICKDCKHFICYGSNWYDQRCGASKLPKSINPVTGKEQYKTKNDLGRTVYTDNPHRDCRDVNTSGNCSLYERGDN